jgi:DNA-binding transcriptional regulator YhcF (GntR family)
MSAHNCGWTRQQFIGAMLDPKNLAGEKYQDMPEVKARKRLERDWERAGDLVDANPATSGAPGVRRHLDHLVEAVMALPWSGRTGGTDRHVLLTVLALAYEVGTYTPAFSTRTLAAASNKRQQTVSRSMARLREAGYLIQVTPSTYTKSAVYRIEVPALQSGSLNPPLGLVVSDPFKSVRTVLGHDLFTRGCLGETAGRLWTQLDPLRDYTVREMAAASGLSLSACRTAAARLAQAGLMSTDQGRPARFRVQAPYGAEPAYLDQIMALNEDAWQEGDSSPDLSAYVGRGDKRAARYDRERQARKLQFAHYDRESGQFVDPWTGEVIQAPPRAA